MPTQTDKLTELREGAPSDELPYISKSRLTTYKTCGRKFFYNYIKGLRPPENFAMKRGTTIHEVFEDYYGNVVEAVENGEELADLMEYLPDDTERWRDFTVPYISNFLMWEYRRLAAAPSRNEWLPVGIEAEGWDEHQNPPWMGYADAILNACSIPEVPAENGVVVVDFKTGKTPDKKYRDEGIFLEGEYYAMLFEDEWDMAAVAGYYPRNDDFITAPLDGRRRDSIVKMVREMNESREKEDFPTEPQPLCKWGEGDDEQCDYYDICPSQWGKRGGPGPTYE